MEWKDGKLVNSKVKSVYGRKVVVRYAAKQKRFTLSTGELVSFR
jgi:hypothetical protein